MDCSEITFNIKDANGQTIYGIIHLPSKPNGGLVLFFNIGLHYRVSHSRLFVLQARHLQKAGFVVARADTTRIGYSHGEMPTGRAIDSFDAVQTGLFKEDALLIIHHLKEAYKPQKIFLYGLCGGALTATIAAALDDDIDGVIFIAGPVTITSPEYELSTLHPHDAGNLLSGYMQRLFSPKAWGRFLTGQTSYGDLFGSIRVKVREKFAGLRNIEVESTDGSLPAENKGDLFNNVFLEAFDLIIKSKRQIYFVMPENDRATYDFDKMFVKYILPRYTPYKDYYEIKRISQADHTFSLPQKAQELLDTARDWLVKKMEI